MVFLLILAACGGSDSGDSAESIVTTAPEVTTAPDTAELPSAEQYVVNSVEFVKAADWDAAEKLTIEMGEMYFAPKDFTLVAGKPYILTLVNVGAVKHEFTAPVFFATLATRKVQTVHSEVKVPFLTEVYVFPGQTVDIYLIPLIAGTYDYRCEIEGHFEAGQFGTITVTGETPTSPAIQLADVASGPWVQNASALIKAADWKAAEKLTIKLGEMYFAPKDFTLVAGKPYILTLENEGKVKHEFTGQEFYWTIAFRKAVDISGYSEALAPHEFEVFSGMKLEIYLIPTKAGTYDVRCEIEGHFEAGQFGTITVTPAT